MAGQRGRLGRDPFHEVAVRHERIGGVVDQLGTEHGAQPLLGQGHPHHGAEPLAEGTGGGLDAEVALDLRVARGGRAQLPEADDVLDVELETGEVEDGVEQH